MGGDSNNGVDETDFFVKLKVVHYLYLYPEAIRRGN